MKRIFFTFFVTLILAGAAFSQGITDADRRGFNELSPINIDVDGDGKLDLITPRVYKVADRSNKRKAQNWIAFDLSTSTGRMIKSIFKYNYGTDEQGGSYWVYALKSAGDINGDGKIDLIFYAGDDTSDETVWLANKVNRFVVFKKKESDTSSW